MPPLSYVTVPWVRCLRATDDAILVETDGGRQVWVPQSCISDDSEVWQPDQEGTLVIPDWLAEQKGLD